MEPTESIGHRIKQVRGELSQKAFGLRIGLSQTAVTALENDQSEPRLGTFNSIVEAFGVNPEWLRTGAGAMKGQLPPIVPSRFEEFEPGKSPMTVVAESQELKQVKSERDFLRKQNELLLEIMKSNATHYAPTGTGGKSDASADAADLYDEVDQIAAEHYALQRETEYRIAAQFHEGHSAGRWVQLSVA